MSYRTDATEDSIPISGVGLLAEQNAHFHGKCVGG